MHTNFISSDPLLRPRVAQNVWQYANQDAWLGFLQAIMKKDCPENLSHDLGTLADYSDDYCKNTNI